MMLIKLIKTISGKEPDIIPGAGQFVLNPNKFISKRKAAELQPILDRMNQKLNSK